MGRPLQPPKIKPLEVKDDEGKVVGVRGYLVTGTVAGKQLKRIVPTRDAANFLAAKWRDARKAAYEYLPTTMTSTQLRDAEAAQPFFDSLGLSATKAAEWLVKHYKKPGTDRWESVIEEFRMSRRTKHRLKDGDPDKPHIVNLVAAVRDFAKHVGRDTIGTPTLEEVESWLKTRGGHKQLLGDFRSFVIWCVKRGKMPENPTITIERQVKIRGKLPDVLRPEVVANHLAILEREAPEWVPYYAVCVFAFIRPGTRDGEARRVDADIRAGQQVVFKDGLFVRVGKNGGARMVPWKFSGPLREWLMAYPVEGGLFPASINSPAKAERKWSVWRKRLGLTTDVLRHTGLSAAFYSGANQNELNMAADNTPRMQKDHYVGLWCEADTHQLWAIKPRYSAINRPKPDSSEQQ